MMDCYPKTYAVRHKKDEVLKKSRSGGVFTALSDYVLSKNGRVYGVIVDEKMNVIHVGTSSTNIRDKMRGSKYVQSNLNNCFKKIKKDLTAGTLVLFTGTPCQVTGLKKFLNREYDNLISIDIVCHGVPSPLVWRKYVEWQQNKNHKKIKSIDFRNKLKYGWRAHYETLYFDKKSVDSFVYKTLFCKHYAIRPSCFKCPFKSIERHSDITIADYWGIENISQQYNDNKGVSLVMLNNEKGDNIFNLINKDIEKIKTKIEDSIQPAMKENYNIPNDYDEFWNDIHKISFDKIVHKYCDYTFKNRIKFKIKSILKK